MDAPPSVGFTPILHAPFVGGVSEPEEELDWEDELSQEIGRVEREMEKDDRRESARETAGDR